MAAWALIILLQIAVTAGLVSASPLKLSQVLGIQKIAQVEGSTPAPVAENPSPPPPAPDAAQPAPNPSPPASDNPAVSPTEAPSSTTAPSPDQSSTSAPAGGEPPAPVEQSAPGSKTEQPPTPTPINLEGGVAQIEAVLNSTDLINTPDNISSKSIDEAKKEDEQLTKATNPTDQTNLLISFATDKVKDMSNFIKADDFSSTNFAAQRFNDQVDQAIANLEKVPAKDQAKAKTQLVNFCNQADAVLRTVQLAVPEESEQDLAIARGQCQELDL